MTTQTIDIHNHGYAKKFIDALPARRRRALRHPPGE